jgi:hypothetical protein
VTKTCENCGQPFECGGYQCWCGQLKITDQQMAWIEKSFHDCLCPMCLQRVVEGTLGPASLAKRQ